MADGITKDEMQDLFEKYFSGAGGGGKGPDPKKQTDEFIKQLKESTEALKKQLPVQKQFENILKGQKQQYVDIDKELEELDKQIATLTKTAKSHEDFNKRDTVQKERDSKAQTAANLNAKIATANFATSMSDVAQTLIKGALQYAKDLQSGASGIEAGTNAAQTAAKATGETVSAVGQALTGLGPAIGAIFKKIPYLGAVLSVAGLALDVFGKKAASVSEEGIKFLGDEVKKTQKAFKDISDTGAVFGGGMTELRKIAADAGLDVAQLATVSRTAKDDLIGMGLGLGEATKRIAGVSKELRTSDLGMQLRKLGFSVEEQATLAASVSARMSAAGDTRVRSDAEVARMTVQYGKDLKVLSDITGQDAKKAMEKARMQAMEQDLLSEAMAKGGPEAVKKLEAQLATMPEAMKKGYMEFVSSGGTAIADAATNVAITQNPRILEQYQQQYSSLSDANKDASVVLRETGKLNEETAAYARENAGATKEVAMASRLTGNQLARGATDIYNSLIQTSARQRKGATKAADEATDAAAKNMEPLDVAVHEVEENAQKLKAAMGEELTGAITGFAQTMASASTTVGEALEKLGINLKEKSTSEKVGEGVGGIAGGLLGGKGGAALGATIGTFLLPGIGTAIGAGLGGIAGMVAGGWAGSKMGEKAGGAVNSMINPPKAMALGGIVNGPTRAILGEGGSKEAVIPLPNGRSVPLDVTGLKQALFDAVGTAAKLTPIGMAASAASSLMPTTGPAGSEPDVLMREQIGLLNEIKDILTNSNSLQQQYVYNTYN